MELERAAQPAAPPAIAGVHLEGLLASGGFADVWRGRRDGRPVAVKVARSADAGAWRRWQREADVLRGVGPPAVPELIAAERLADGRACLILERVAGPSLADELEASEEPDARAARAHSLALCDAVAQVHRRGFVHRDLKPENVIAVAPGRAVLLDLGLATGRGGDAMADELHGTIEYMAPELLVAGANASARSDIYALGVLIHELFTLTVPFGGDRATVEQGHRARLPPAPSSVAVVPRGLDAVVVRCLAKRPADRFAEVGELRDELAGLAEVAGAPPVSGDADPPLEPEAVALVFFRALPIVRPRIEELVALGGGQIAYSGPDRFVAGFLAAGGTTPLRGATRVARRLLSTGIARSARIDERQVRLRRRGAGVRFVAGDLQRDELYPDEDASPGLQVAERLQHLIGELDAPAQGTPLPDPELAIPLVGRDDVVRALLDGGRRAHATSRPAMATILGEAGMGKSSLLVALRAAIGRELAGATVTELRAPNPAGQASDALLAELLTEVFAPLDATQGARGLEPLLGAQAAAEVYPAVGLALGWLQTSDPRVEAMRAAPGVLRQAVARAIADGLRARSRQRPLVMILDDAHWADDAALDALEHATTGEHDEDLPLWIVVFARPDLTGARPRWGDRASRHQVERLGALDRRSASELCRALLAPVEVVPDPVVDRLVARAQGVPLLLVELCRGLRREGWIRRSARGEWYVAGEGVEHLPELPAIDWLVEREVAALPEELAGFARVLAQLAPELGKGEVEAILARVPAAERAHLAPLDVGVALDRMVRAGVLVATRSRGFGFRHALVREAVARGTPAGVARRVHEAALEHFQHAARDEAARLPRIALHAAATGRRELAADASLALAELARDRHAYLDAELAYGRALALLPDGDRRRRMHAHHRRADARYRASRFDDALQDFADARRLAEKLDDRAELIAILLEEALAHDWMQSFPAERDLVARAAALAVPAPPTAVAARLALMQGCVEYRFNPGPRAILLLEQAVERAAALGDLGYEIQVGALLLLGCLFCDVGRLAEAEQVFARLDTSCRAKGDDRHLGAMLVNRTYLWMAKRQRGRLEADLREAIIAARRLGSTAHELYAQRNMASYLYWSGDFAAAERHARRYTALAEGGEPSRARPDGRVLIARLTWARGDHDGARTMVDDIRRHQSAAAAAGHEQALLLPPELVLLEMLELALEDAPAEAWRALAARAARVSSGQDQVEVLAIGGLRAARTGDAARAHALWGDALDLCATVPTVLEEQLRSWLRGARGDSPA